MKGAVLFRFTGADSLAQFGLWLAVLGAGVVPVPFVLFGWGGFTALVVLAFSASVLLLGLRSSVVVTSSKATVTKLWFVIPYMRFSGVAIEDIWFGGDGGEAKGASGVVVRLGGREIHIGSRRTMHHLYKSIGPLTSKSAQHVAQPTVPADPHASASLRRGVG